MTHTDLNLSRAVTAQHNGHPATAEDLAPLAFAGYAHFTALQVRGGRVRGLDLHLQRLHAASLTLFGCALSDDEVRGQLRAALAAHPAADCSLTASVSSPAGEFTPLGGDAPLHLLVRASAPSDGPAGPLALDIVQHERLLPEIKHLGESAKTWFLRQAVTRGFDDAAFCDAHGRLSEASIWNLAFWDGQHVVWPQAAMLRGTTMSIVMRQLTRAAVPQRTEIITRASLSRYQGAAVMNSWTPGVAVQRLGAMPLPAAPAFLAMLQRAFAAEPLQTI